MAFSLLPSSPPNFNRFRGTALAVVLGAALTARADASGGAFLTGNPFPEAWQPYSPLIAMFAGVLAAAAFVLAWRYSRSTVALKRRNDLLEKELQASEERRFAMFENSPEGLFEADLDGQLTVANSAFAKMHGYRSPEAALNVAKELGSRFFVDEAHRGELQNLSDRPETELVFEGEFVRSDAQSVWLRIKLRAARDMDGKPANFEGSAEDVTGEWWSSQRQRLHVATAVVLEGTTSVETARPRILEAICGILDWSLGAVWDIDAAAGTQECVEIWHAAGVKVEAFERANANVVQPIGSGLAGEVWRAGKPDWVADLASEAAFENDLIALEAGMGSAFGIPIRVRGEVRHVLEFFSRKSSRPDPELLQTLEAIGSQLGGFIERVWTDEALQGSELKKAAMLDSAHDGFIGYDENGVITDFNPAAERIVGVPAAEAVGRHIEDVLLAPGESADRLLASGMEGGCVEFTAVRADGTPFRAELATSKTAHGGQTFFTGSLRDLSERHAGRQAASDLAAAVENSNDAILACTPDGVVRSWNSGAERIFGYLAAEAVGKPLHMLMPRDRMDEFTFTLNAVGEGQSLSNYETVRIRKDGKKINVSVTESPILDEDGEIIGLSSIIRDITERKKMEEELLQSHKMDAVGRLAGGIAHDFNNVLTAILGYSDLLMGQIEQRHWMWKNLNEIRTAADFAAELTHQLLAFSRRQPLYPRVFAVNDSVLKIEKMLQRVIGEQIKVRTDLGAITGRVKADVTQFDQVLLNLAVNARDAMPDGGVLTIATSDVSYDHSDPAPVKDMPTGEYVRLVVADGGVGIPEDTIKHIFEPFFTTKEDGKGTGLGLATCYGIVKQSGGYIGVQSTVGQGTTFSIYLPRVDEKGDLAPRPKRVDSLPGGIETILYVEDELTVRSLTAHVLRRLGYTVLEACDGAQARTLCESHMSNRIDLVLADVVLPDLGGRELYEWVNKRRSDARVLYCSGYVDEQVLEKHGIVLGTPFLQKPFSPADLAMKVREVMDSSN